MDAELHAVVAILSTGPVGLGDTCVFATCYTNGSIVRRLAREDGILLRPDRPLAPVDIMWGSLLKNAPDDKQRTMPGLCTKKQEDQGNTASCGARLWQTHATIGVEMADAPELATSPTRKLVSHAAFEGTATATAEDYVKNNKVLLQHLIVSVDQEDNFVLTRSDLYPRIGVNRSLVFIRRADFGGGKGTAGCMVGADAISTGCVKMLGPGEEELFDVTTQNTSCSTGSGGDCSHRVGVWQVFFAAPGDDLVVLGDLRAYVSLSGYRFRLQAEGNRMIAVGKPGEAVPVTFLRKTASGAWIVGAVTVLVGSGGRVEFDIYRDYSSTSS